MKKIGKYLFLLLSTSTSAQITLDTTLTDANLLYFFNTAQISDTETKYYFADTVTNTFSLYNMDFTPFLLNVAVPEPFIKPAAIGVSIFRAIYVTRALFDCDGSNIEYAYEAATHSEETFYIMRTDGTQLFQLDSANGPYCFGDCLGGADWVKPIENTSSGTKLFLQRYWPDEVKIYSLCGSLPQSTDVMDNNEYISSVRLYPNPTSNTLTFEVSPPSNMEEFELVIVDNAAKEVMNKRIRSRERFTIDLSTLSNGTYIYSLCTKTKSYKNGKFIINK